MTTPVSPDDEVRTLAEDTLVALGNTDIVARSWVATEKFMTTATDSMLEGREAVAVRFRNRYLPNAHITTYVFVSPRQTWQRGSAPPEHFFIVEEATQYFIGDRPVDEEDCETVWSHLIQSPHLREMTTERDALRWRDQQADAAMTADADVHVWDGTQSVRRRNGFGTRR